MRRPNMTTQSLTEQQQAAAKEFLSGNFYLTPEVMVRFAEYARWAQPNEIGGYCRVQQSGDNFIATDLIVFPQQASSVYWEDDGLSRAKWQHAMMKEGRTAELKDWNCLIHSHPPGCAPFLSGTDEEMIRLLGHRRHAWSIIMTANRNITALDWRVHFYAGGSVDLLARDLPVDTLHPDWKEIRQEVSAATGRDLESLGGFPGSPPPLTAGATVVVQVRDLERYDEEVREQVDSMDGMPYEIDDVDTDRGMVIIDGMEFHPDDFAMWTGS